MGVKSLAGSTPVPGIEVLRELHISNLAVIDDLVMEFDAGLNVFTGQTGAGKSLIIGAFESLLGLRSGSDMLRPGADEARISGIFEVHDSPLASELSQLLDIQIQSGEQVLITRKMFASGRTSLSVNGQPATAGMVRRVSQLLVDIHGQHDHQYLLKPSNQLLILDAFGQSLQLRRLFQQALVRYRELYEQKKSLLAGCHLRRQQLELYEFQADEIDSVDPQPGEFIELQARHDVLVNLEQIKRQTGQVHAALYESEGSVVERLEVMCHVLGDLLEIDPTLDATTSQLREATMSLREVAYELAGYAGRLDLDPGELIEVQERLNLLNRLVQKYGDSRNMEDPLGPVLAYRTQIGGEIRRLRGEGEDLSRIDQELEQLHDQLMTLGADLSDMRHKAADQLLPLIEKQLKELGMEEARFHVDFVTVCDEEKASAGGFDTVEMMARTNPGQEFRALRKIASGGELSRVMLALKSVLADNDRISVLVFDEIDANIGGRLGSVIGRKLRELASGGVPRRKGRNKAITGTAGQHQVLCITHLPQIAAFADRHFHVRKSYAGKGKSRETTASVMVLEGTARLHELAEMMAGKQVSDTTYKQAAELLEAAGR